MIRETLIQNLDAVGKPTETWKSPDGTQVLVLPHGGRILGLFAPGDEENFFWTHTALSSVDSARDFYAGDQWHNSGGERTWLAPEVDFFFPDFPKLDRYWQQRELDPGSYHIAHENGALTWKTRASLAVSRSKRTVDLEITKTLGPALNPLRNETCEELGLLRFAGYSVHSSLQLVGSYHPPFVGLWQLIQLPHDGDMLVPTVCLTEPKVYMGEIGAADLIADEQLVRYRMRAPGEHKLGIRAAAITGRAGYLHASGDGEASLMIRNFHVNPSGDYADVPWLEPENFGFAFQACNVNSHLGAFSELEYHVPAIGSSSGKSFSEDESQLWAFRGPQRAVESVARRLLCAEA